MHTLEQLARNRARALSELPIMGRTREFGKLLSFAHSRTPALLCGPPGTGKTRLLLELKRELMTEGSQVIYIHFRQPLHAFLLDFARQLCIPCSSTSSTALRGALWNEFEKCPSILLLDGICAATAPFYRFLERILSTNGNAIIGSAPNEYATGALQRVFWNQQSVIKLAALNRADAASLIDLSISQFVKDRSLPPDFAERVAQAARGNPGRIVEMCIRAADPAYRGDNDHLRFGALVMDSVTGFLP